MSQIYKECIYTLNIYYQVMEFLVPHLALQPLPLLWEWKWVNVGFIFRGEQSHNCVVGHVYLSTTMAENDRCQMLFSQEKRRKSDNGGREIHLSPFRHPLTQLNHRPACLDASKHVSCVHYCEIFTSTKKKIVQGQQNNWMGLNIFQRANWTGNNATLMVWFYQNSSMQIEI